jgi:hypothetical protein
MIGSGSCCAGSVMLLPSLAEDSEPRTHARRNGRRARVSAFDIDRYVITRIYLRGARKSGGGSVGLWKVDLAEGQESGHKAVAAGVTR